VTFLLRHLCLSITLDEFHSLQGPHTLRTYLHIDTYLTKYSAERKPYWINGVWIHKIT